MFQHTERHIKRRPELEAVTYAPDYSHLKLKILLLCQLKPLQNYPSSLPRRR